MVKKPAKDLGVRSPEYYVNRELSWLSFARRVLALVEQGDLPLLERIKFAGIVGPLLFAVVGSALGSSRWGILALIILFILGAILLRGVDPERARRQLAT